ncbi:hypothetical protein [Caenibius sp. WL]|uniref:hypothetical protein n=1 Tax=Caenibius sp. WL TaxID=2872646 RepID=UPI001C9A14B4|nr:hypothetical protein [Caenibius sp. WL]QZP07779.1 hypothetical protein K5X80_14170 [Caenibius sp. WL]QZP09988.1 hypothetical protein K5X80_16760 [Caenibius sp. WL]
MAVNYNVAVKTARMTTTRDHFANGTLELLTAADAVLVTFGLSASGGTISGDTWTFVLDANTVAATGTGTATKAQLKTSGGTANLTGLTVGTTGTDIILNNTSIATGQDVTLSSATIKHA